MFVRQYVFLLLNVEKLVQKRFCECKKNTGAPNHIYPELQMKLHFGNDTPNKQGHTKPWKHLPWLLGFQKRIRSVQVICHQVREHSSITSSGIPKFCPPPCVIKIIEGLDPPPPLIRWRNTWMRVAGEKSNSVLLLIAGWPDRSAEN